MWIGCKCGAQIKDVTDAVQNKGHLLTDRDWFAANEREPATPLSAWDWLKWSRSVYECFECGRLWVSDSKKKTFRSFVPESDKASGLLWED